MSCEVCILIFCDLFENRGGLAYIIRVHSIFELKNVIFFSPFLMASLITLVRDMKKLLISGQGFTLFLNAPKRVSHI